MIKRFCDCNGCNREASMTIKAPRNVLRYVKDAHGNTVSMYRNSEVELRETDVCEFHAQILAGCMYEIRE